MGRRQEGLEQNLSTIGGRWSKISPTELFSLKAQNYLSLKRSPWGPITSDSENLSAQHYLRSKGKPGMYQYPPQLHSRCLQQTREERQYLPYFSNFRSFPLLKYAIKLPSLLHRCSHIIPENVIFCGRTSNSGKWLKGGQSSIYAMQ